MAEYISVEVIYALRNLQEVEKLLVPFGTTILDAILQSKTYEKYEELHNQKLSFGVFSKERDEDYILIANDRIEIYRVLEQDPKTRRENLVKD